MSSRVLTRRRIAVWALAVGASGVACSQTSKRDVPRGMGGSGGHVDPSGMSTGGRTAGTGGTGSAVPSDGGAGADQTGGAVASGTGTPAYVEIATMLSSTHM